MILDTNALSAAADREPSALAIVSEAERIVVPVIALGEYRLGIAQSRHRVSYENWLQEWISSVTVLDIDEETSQSYAASAWNLRGREVRCGTRPRVIRRTPEIENGRAAMVKN